MVSPLPLLSPKEYLLWREKSWTSSPWKRQYLNVDFLEWEKKVISKQEAISLREQGNHYETLIWQVHSVILIFSGVILYYFWKEEIHNEFVLFSMLLLGFLLNLYGLVIILNMYSKQQESYKRSNEILTDIFKELSYLRIGIYGDVFIWFFIFCLYLISFFIRFEFIGLSFALIEIILFLLLTIIRIIKHNKKQSYV